MCGVGRRARRRCSDLAARPFRRDDREGPAASEERETLLSQYPRLSRLCLRRFTRRCLRVVARCELRTLPRNYDSDETREI